MNKKYEHVFFDLDRTLWHFDENSKKVLMDIYCQFDLNQWIQSAQEFVKRYQIINEDLWRLYRNNKVSKEELRWRRFDETLLFFSVKDRALATDIGEYYIEHSPRQTQLFPHTIEVLDYLSSKYQLHIITNGFEEVQHIKLSASGLLKYFDVIVLSEKVGVKKPHPFIFKKALSSSGANVENSIMIGDDWYADIYGAQRVNMDNIYFNYTKEEHANPIDKEINCLSELYEIL
jgi:putative hydrolase of the HAD superfamily